MIKLVAKLVNLLLKELGKFNIQPVYQKHALSILPNEFVFKWLQYIDCTTVA